MIVAASVLSCDYTNLTQQLKDLEGAVDWIHFDVMDGNFVPNISFGPKILEDIKKVSNLPLDVHIMVSNPFLFGEVFAKMNVFNVTFHYEALDSLEECKKCIDLIHSYGCKAGISIKPGTNPEAIEPLLKDLDLVLVMSVEPGFGGQKFMPSAYTKLNYFRDYKKEHNLDYYIQVDGGVSDVNSKELVEAGAESLVSGSYLFKGNIADQVNKMRNR